MEAKKLYRSRTNKMIAGVCEGLSKYFKLDVVLIRLIFVIGTIWSCIFPFFLLYIILWIITPKELIEPAVKSDPVDTQPTVDQTTTDTTTEYVI